jgi:hypothetical protein
VAGEHLPPLSPRAWEALLRSTAGPDLPFRLVRSETHRAVVEVDHAVSDHARSAWNAPLERSTGQLSTVRTWGTLIGAKRWLRGSPTPA